VTEDAVAHFRLLARYNARANARLYDACAAMPAEEIARPRGAFFGSILGTLNHILVGDRIWMARFAGQTVPSTGLDAILHDTLADLRAAREAEDARIAGFVDGLGPADLAGAIVYVDNAGNRREDPRDLLLLHVFNHQTHHRGQVHDLMSRAGVAPPSLDMHRVMRP